MLNTRTILSAAALSIVATGLQPAPASAQETLRMTIAAGYPEVFPWVRLLRDVFIPTLDTELARHGEVQIEWTQAWGGTLVRLGSEIDAFQDGIIDVAHLGGLFDPARLGLMTFTYAMPFGPTDPRMLAAAAERALIETPGALEMIEEAAGAAYIGGAAAIDNYNIGARHAFRTLSDMDGIKIGGAGPALTWLRGTGSVGVQGSFVSFYNDISTGVYDGFIGWVTANAPGRLYEVAPYWNQVDFGAMYVGGIGVSQLRWDTLSETTRDAFRVAAQAYSDAYFAETEASYDTALQTMLDNGTEVVVMEPASRQAWIEAMPNPTSAWIAAAEARGEPGRAVLETYIDILAEQGFTFARDYLAD